jgi:UDPglucose 6-dehydrogenase
VLQVNEARKRRMADKIIAACGGTLAGKKIAVLGLTFKPNTDDMRDAPSLVILPALTAAGARLRAFDRRGSRRRENCCLISSIAKTPTKRWKAPTRSCS